MDGPKNCRSTFTPAVDTKRDGGPGRPPPQRKCNPQCNGRYRMDSTTSDSNDHIDDDDEPPIRESSPLPPEQDGCSAETDTGNERRRSSQPAQAEQLCQIAEERFCFSQTSKGEPYAVEIEGPNLALMLSGGRQGLKSMLAKCFRKKYGNTPSATALNDAFAVLEGIALESSPLELFTRIARHEDSLIVDLGDETGRAVVISPGSWCIVDRSPVTFRRTQLTAAFPTPDETGNINDLQRLINVAPESFPLLVGWMAATLIMPGLPRPILLLGGMQGSGKSSCARLITGLVDPSTAPLKDQPTSSESWALLCYASSVIAVDNVSKIPHWWSEALCRTVTGDAFVRRTNYKDQDLSVAEFQRAVILTSIDIEAFRGDLAERLLLVELEPIPPDQRRAESTLNERYKSRQAKLFGGLLNLAAEALKELPSVDLDEMPRMADFAQLLAALDGLDGSDGSALKVYVAQSTRIADEVVTADPVGVALLDLLARQNGHWDGNATELLHEIRPERPPKGWPKTGRAVSGQLKRLTPALQKLGVTVERDRSATSDRKRLIHISRESEPSTSSKPSSGCDTEPGGDWEEV